MKHRIISLAALIALLMGSWLPAQAYDFQAGGLNYNITSSQDRTVEVTYLATGSTNMGYVSGDVVIPATVSSDGVDYTVTAIGQDAFARCQMISSLSIPATVTSIKARALQHMGVQGGMTEFIVPSTVREIGTGAFAHCSTLQWVGLPEGLLEIADSLFYDCMSLDKVVIPRTVKRIGSQAFAEMTQFDFVIPSSVETMADDIYTPFGTYRFFILCHPTASHGGIRKQQMYSSYVHLPSELYDEYVNDDVWSQDDTYYYEFCDFAEDGFFYTVTSQEDLTVKITQPNGMPVSSMWGDVTIPSTVTHNGVTYNVTELDQYAFGGCSHITSVTVPSSITSMGNTAFTYCESLASVTLPPGVTTLEEYIFFGCKKLASVTLMGPVTTIHDDAFYYCPSLTSLYLLGSTVPSGHGQLDSNTATIYVPASMVDAYKAHESWSGFDIQAATVTIDIPATGYATLYTGRQFIMPQGVTGVTITGGDDGTTLAQASRYVAGDTVPPLTALLLTGSEGTHTGEVVVTSLTAPADNWLRGTLETRLTTSDNEGDKFYKLVATSEGATFAHGATDGAAFTNPVGEAYLVVPAQASHSQATEFAITTALFDGPGFYTYEASGDGLKAVLGDDFKTELGKATGGEYTHGGITWRTGDPVPNPAPSGMVDSLKVVDFSYLYYQLDSITTLDLSLVDTRYATNLQDMCSNNPMLRTIKLGSMNTENVTNMTGMFSTCDSLRVIEGIDSLNTASVTSFYGMFLNASSLQSMDLSSWNTSNVTNMHRMLEGCRALTSVGDLSGWDVSQVTTLRSMFYNCRSLKSLNLHGWNTGNVTDMGYMFQDCKAMESIDVRVWDTTKSTSFFNMFRNMDALTTLDVSDFSFLNVTSYGNMFYDCDNLENVYLPTGITRTFTNSMFNASPKVVINVPVGWLTTYNNLNLHTGRTRQEYLRENDDPDMFLPYGETGVPIKLTRSFTAREWTTLCLPFSLTQEQIKSVFGEKTLVARYTTYDSENYTMGFDLVDNIEAQIPYLIKPSQDVVNPMFESVDIYIGSAGLIVPEGQQDAPKLVGVFGYWELLTAWHFIDTSAMTATMVNRIGSFLGGMRAYVEAMSLDSHPDVINLVINGDTLTGDVNGDGAVDIDDVNAVINVILGTATNDAADVNNDGTVDIDDVNLIINIILGK